MPALIRCHPIGVAHDSAQIAEVWDQPNSEWITSITGNDQEWSLFGPFHISFEKTVSIGSHQFQNSQGFVSIDAQAGFRQDVQETSKFDDGFM